MNNFHRSCLYCFSILKTLPNLGYLRFFGIMVPVQVFSVLGRLAKAFLILFLHSIVRAFFFQNYLNPFW